ncbi:hypothetical protein ACJJID_19375 [Microbulbifer sp. CnH-101-G]|uniref:hypothetical protein n=1 Tax=Microbulbifer sp. CnH-101-G TaxID=3243393 RepID=UPI0040397B23
MIDEGTQSAAMSNATLMCTLISAVPNIAAITNRFRLKNRMRGKYFLALLQLLNHIQDKNRERQIKSS